MTLRLRAPSARAVPHMSKQKQALGAQIWSEKWAKTLTWVNARIMGWGYPRLAFPGPGLSRPRSC